MKTKIALSATILLVGCGGGGSDEAVSSDPAPAPVQAPGAASQPVVQAPVPSSGTVGSGTSVSNPVPAPSPTPSSPVAATPPAAQPSPAPVAQTPAPPVVAQPPAPVASPPAQPPASPPPAQPAPAPVVVAPPVAIEYRTLRCETYTTTHGRPTGISGYNLNVVRDRSKFPWAGITVSPDSAYTGALIDDADGSKIGSSEVVDRPDGNVSVTLFGDPNYVLDYTVYTFTKSGEIINIHPGMLPGRVSFLCQ